METCNYLCKISKLNKCYDCNDDPKVHLTNDHNFILKTDCKFCDKVLCYKCIHTHEKRNHEYFAEENKFKCDYCHAESKTQFDETHGCETCVICDSKFTHCTKINEVGGNYFGVCYKKNSQEYTKCIPAFQQLRNYGSEFIIELYGSTQGIYTSDSLVLNHNKTVCQKCLEDPEIFEHVFTC